jgi:ADP-ribosyl-[dinitrogen reductase] hydrolase
MLSNAQKLDRAIGSIIGLATGDALGSTVEFMTKERIIREFGAAGQTEMRGGGAFNWQVGEYTDDGQMMLRLLQSLVEINQYKTSDEPKELDITDLGIRFVQWLESRPPDVGNTTRTSLNRLQDGVPADLSGDDNPQSQANGAVMRCSPVAVLWHQPARRAELIRDSVKSAMPTHRSEISMYSVVVANVMIAEFINGSNFNTALKAALEAADGTAWRHHLNEWIMAKMPHKGNSGWAVSTVLTALHCLHTTDSYEAAVVKAVNGGDDADTVGAVTGAIAGAFYGASAIPSRWTEVLKDRDLFTRLATTLFELGEFNTDDRM